MKTHCIECGEEFDDTNTFTEAGKRETQITGYCEVCFDNLFTHNNLEESLCDYKKNSKDISDILSIVEKNNKKVYLAGGFWRQDFDGIPLSDIDLFFHDKTALEGVKEDLYTLGYNLVFECPQGSLFTFKCDDMKVQLITEKAYASLEECVDSFDIIACCCGWDGENWYNHRRFQSDCQNKEIGFNVITHPVATFKRIQKYISKGYMIPNTSIQKYVTDIVLNTGGDVSLVDTRFYID